MYLLQYGSLTSASCNGSGSKVGSDFQSQMFTLLYKYEEKREEEGTFQFLITGPARSVK